MAKTKTAAVAGGATPDPALRGDSTPLAESGAGTRGSRRRKAECWTGPRALKDAAIMFASFLLFSSDAVASATFGRLPGMSQAGSLTAAGVVVQGIVIVLFAIAIMRLRVAGYL